MQHTEVAETDRDLEGTGLSRPKKTTSQPEKPPEAAADVEGIDPEELMESAKSVQGQTSHHVGRIT